MADLHPAEAANRQLVQQMAMQGAAAKQQAPQLATAPEAVQTAMNRSAGVQAPEAFNATQVPIVQNPYTRADAQLAANNAGAGGVTGAINSSTANYLQQAQAALPLQTEMTKRAVQKALSEEQLTSMQHEVGMARAAADLAAIKAEADPNSPAGKLKILEAQNAYTEAQRKQADLALQNKPSTPDQVSKQTGLDVGTINAFQALPTYPKYIDAANTLANAGYTAQDYASIAYSQAQQAVESGEIPKEQLDAFAHFLVAKMGPTMPEYSVSLAGGPSSGPPVQGGMPGLTAPLPGGGTPGTMQGYNEAMTRLGNAPPAVGSQAAAHIAEQQHIAEAERAGVLTPATVSMSETDAKKLAAELVKSAKGKKK